MTEHTNDQQVARTGRLLLVPNTLDLGCPDPVTGLAPDALAAIEAWGSIAAEFWLGVV